MKKYWSIIAIVAIVLVSAVVLTIGMNPISKPEYSGESDSQNRSSGEKMENIIELAK